MTTCEPSSCGPGGTTDSQALLAQVGRTPTPKSWRTLMNALFVAQSHRAGVTVYLVLESTRDYSRTIRFEIDAMRDIGGFDERALLGKVAKALDASRGMGRTKARPVEPGSLMRTTSLRATGGSWPTTTSCS